MSQSLRHSDEEEAARWFARRRRGMMTLEEHAAYESWRREPANAAAMAEFERIWSLLESAPASARPVPERPARHMGLRRSALVAVMCLFSLGLGVVSYSGNSGFWTKLDWVER